MIISCPSCSAKYQLADSKIKASGTKVRCPRCSHTFSVYREQDEDNYQSEKTELFIRRDEVLNQAPPPKPKAKAPVEPPPPPPRREEIEEEENIFDQKTSVSTSAPPPPSKSKVSKVKKPEVEETAPPKVVEKKPKKEDPARIVTPESFDDEAVAEEAFASAEDSSSREIKPFGEATLFEIQRGFGKKKAPKHLIKYLGIAASLTIVGFLGFKIFDSSSDSSSSATSDTSVEAAFEMLRPNGWYRDDPQVYLDTLSQIAALPPAEQDKSDNRALLAEALILSGLQTGASDQVITGMGFASSLVVSYPLTPLGYYGIAAYALWNEDRRTVQDLVDRWPEAFRDDPEFALVEFANDMLLKNYEAGFEKLNKILTSSNEFQRANDFGLLYTLRHKEIASKHLSNDQIKQMEEKYLKHRSLMERELKSLPKIPQMIDGLLESSKPKEEVARVDPKAKEKPKASTQKSEVPIPPEKTFPGDDRPSAKAPTKPTAKKQGSRLPAPSANLIAQNKVSEKQRSEASKLFETGNRLYKQGKADDALKSYRDALKLNPEFADIYKRIGMIYMSRQESDRALRSFKIYLQLKPDSDDKQLVEGWISSLQ